MKNKSLILIRDSIDYKVKTKETDLGLKYVLKRVGDSWTSSHKNTTVVSCLDTGDGMILKFDSKLVELDYSEFADLIMLSTVMRKKSKNLMDKFKIL